MISYRYFTRSSWSQATLFFHSYLQNDAVRGFPRTAFTCRATKLFNITVLVSFARFHCLVSSAQPPRGELAPAPGAWCLVYGVARPVRLNDCGLPVALSVKVIVPVRVTFTAEVTLVNLTPTVQV